MKKYYAKEENVRKQKESMQGRMQTYYAIEENAQKQKESMRGRMQMYYADEDNAQKQRETMREYYAHEDNAEKQRKTMREYYADEDNAEKQRKTIREYYADEDNTEKQRKKMQMVINVKRAQITPKLLDLQEYESKEDELLASLNINESKKQYLKAIQKSTHSGKKHFHKDYICIVRYQFIVGKEKV